MWDLGEVALQEEEGDLEAVSALDFKVFKEEMTSQVLGVEEEIISASGDLVEVALGESIALEVHIAFPNTSSHLQYNEKCTVKFYRFVMAALNKTMPYLSRSRQNFFHSNLLGLLPPPSGSDSAERFEIAARTCNKI